MERLTQIITILIALSVLVNSGFATVIFSTGTVSGTVNGSPISGSLSGTGDTATGFVSGAITGLDSVEVAAIFEINSLLSWKCRATAMTTGSALNLLDLTGGDFSMYTSVYFDTSDTLTLNTTVTNLGSNTLGAMIEIGGTAPVFDPIDTVHIDDYTEDWTQISDLTIGMSSSRTFTVNGISHWYSWYSTVVYDGAIPLPLDQTRHAWDTDMYYDFGSETLHIGQHNLVVPEPATILLLGLGGLAMFRRRR